MAVAFTLVFGAPLFWFALETNGGRAARGLAGAEAWLLAWLLAVAGAAITMHFRRLHGQGRDVFGGAHALAFGSLFVVWTGVTATVVSARAGDFGIRSGALVIAALVTGLAAIAVVAVRASRPLVPLPITPTPTLVSATLPWLLPIVALAGIRALPEAPQWSGAISGLGMSGILFLQIETVAWPAVVVVAWGWDALHGHGRDPLLRAALGVAVFALVATTIVPVCVEPEDSLTVARVGPDGERATVLADFDALIRATSAMLLLCAGLCAWLLRRVGEGGRALDALEVAVLAVVGVVGTVVGVPRVGPEAAPLAVAAAAALTWLLTWRRGNSLSAAPAS